MRNQTVESLSQTLTDMIVRLGVLESEVDRLMKLLEEKADKDHFHPPVRPIIYGGGSNQPINAIGKERIEHLD